MKKKNTSAKKKIPNFYFNKLKNRKIKKIYLEFKKNINEFSDKKLCVAVSGGSDSLALTFLVKCMHLTRNVKAKLSDPPETATQSFLSLNSFMFFLNSKYIFLILRFFSLLK